MHDNRNMKGSNWEGQCPRSLKEAYGFDAKLYETEDSGNSLMYGFIAVLVMVVLAFLYALTR